MKMNKKGRSPQTMTDINSIINIARLMLLPVFFVLLHSLTGNDLIASERRHRNPKMVHLLQSIPSNRVAPVNTVDTDSMRRMRNMQAPVPSSTDIQRLRIDRIVPAPADNLDPTFDITGEVELPCPPDPAALLGKLLWGYIVPAETAICRELDAFWPSTAARVGPALAFNLAAVDDGLFVPGGHDG